MARHGAPCRAQRAYLCAPWRVMTRSRARHGAPWRALWHAMARQCASLGPAQSHSTPKAQSVTGLRSAADSPWKLQTAETDKVHRAYISGKASPGCGIAKNDKVLGAPKCSLVQLPGDQKSGLCHPHRFLSTSQRFFRWWFFSSKSIKPTWVQTLPFRMYITTLPPGARPQHFVIFFVRAPPPWRNLQGAGGSVVISPSTLSFSMATTGNNRSCGSVDGAAGSSTL